MDKSTLTPGRIARPVETLDFMTARWAHLPYELLDAVSRRIINETAGISLLVRAGQFQAGARE